jgi:hypothetical protein
MKSFAKFNPFGFVLPQQRNVKTEYSNTEQLNRNSMEILLQKRKIFCKTISI